MTSVADLQPAGSPFQILFKIPLAPNYAVVGGVDFQSDQGIDARIRQILDMWIDGKQKSIGKPGVDSELAQKDLAALNQAKGSSRPYVFTGYQASGVTAQNLPEGADTREVACPGETASSSSKPSPTFPGSPTTSPDSPSLLAGPEPPPCEVPGPDAGGYLCDIVDFAREDVSGGTSVSLTDDSVSSAISLPFTFPWYGGSKTSVYIGSNGLLCFNSTGCTSYNPPAPPNTSTPNDLLACFWEDLNPGAGGTITYKTVGASPNRTFVVEFSFVPHYSTGGINTFQLWLTEKGHAYCMLDFVSPDGDLMPTAVGTENSSGSTGVRYKYDTFVSYGRTGIRFSPYTAGTSTCTDWFDELFTCERSYNDNYWAPDHGYWDFHWFYNDGDGNKVHVLFMYTSWSTLSRLALFQDSADGFEVNASLEEKINSATYYDVWASDYPGAYLQWVRNDDEVSTFGVGSDQAENLVSGRQYQNQVWIKALSNLDGMATHYYQKVDLHMLPWGGDSAFFYDEACGDEMTSCVRDMLVGEWEDW